MMQNILYIIGILFLIVAVNAIFLPIVAYPATLVILIFAGRKLYKQHKEKGAAYFFSQKARVKEALETITKAETKKPEPTSPTLVPPKPIPPPMPAQKFSAPEIKPPIRPVISGGGILSTPEKGIGKAPELLAPFPAIQKEPPPPSIIKPPASIQQPSKMPSPEPEVKSSLPMRQAIKPIIPPAETLRFSQPPKPVSQTPPETPFSKPPSLPAVSAKPTSPPINLPTVPPQEKKLESVLPPKPEQRKSLWTLSDLKQNPPASPGTPPPLQKPTSQTPQQNIPKPPIAKLEEPKKSISSNDPYKEPVE